MTTTRERAFATREDAGVTVIELVAKGMQKKNANKNEEKENAKGERAHQSNARSVMDCRAMQSNRNCKENIATHTCTHTYIHTNTHSHVAVAWQALAPSERDDEPGAGSGTCGGVENRIL